MLSLALTSTDAGTDEQTMDKKVGSGWSFPSLKADKTDIPLCERRHMSAAVDDNLELAKLVEGLRLYIGDKDQRLYEMVGMAENALKKSAMLSDMNTRLMQDNGDIQTRYEEAQVVIADLQRRLDDNEMITRKIHEQFAEDYQTLLASTAAAITRLVQHRSCDPHVPIKDLLSNSQRTIEETTLAVALGREVALNSQLQQELQRYREAATEKASNEPADLAPSLDLSICRPQAEPSPMRFAIAVEELDEPQDEVTSESEMGNQDMSSPLKRRIRRRIGRRR